MSLKKSWTACLILVLFTAYYHVLSMHLPSGAGPDEGAHVMAIDFIVQHGRLATYPEDVDEIYLTPSGSTRAFREPFPHLWSAVVSKIYSQIVFHDQQIPTIELVHSHRQGTVLFAALSVVLLFLIVSLLAGGIGGAIVAAVALGLLPQFAFLASYSNSDMAALCLLLWLILSLVLVVKFRTRISFVCLGLACGLVLLVKPTIWMPALIVLPFAFILIEDRPAFKRLFLIALPVALVASFWWYAFNAYHNGIENTFGNGQVKAELSANYGALAPDARQSYAELGYGVFDLLGNAQDFLTKTYKSSIGFLDWFKVSLGPVQYISYGLVLALGVGFLLFSMVRPPSRVALPGWRLLAVLLVAGMVAQFCVYVGWNLYGDRQPQGRYLLPVLSFGFVGFGLLVSGLLQRVRSGLACLIVIGGIAALLAIHAQAMFRYVIPYYSPRVLLTTPSELVPLALQNPDVFVQAHNLEIRDTGAGIYLSATGPDPWAVVDLTKLENFRKFNCLVLDIDPREYDWFRLYWDKRQGFNEARSVSHALRSRRRTMTVSFPAGAARLRLDFGEKDNNAYEIHALALGKAEPVFPRLEYEFALIDRLFGDISY